MSIEHDSQSKGNIYQLDPKLILVERGFNVRADMGDLEPLAADIAAHGVLVPIQIRRREKGLYYLVDGHRRLAAAKLAKCKSIPCVMEVRGTTAEGRIFSMLSRNAGKPLTDAEQGEAYRRLLGFGCGLAEIARRTGHGKPYIEGCLQLASHPELGSMAPTVAANLARVDSGAVGKVIEANAKTGDEVKRVIMGRAKWLPKSEVKKTWESWAGVMETVRITEFQAGYIRALEVIMGRSPALPLK